MTGRPVGAGKHVKGKQLAKGRVVDDRSKPLLMKYHKTNLNTRRMHLLITARHLFVRGTLSQEVGPGVGARRVESHTDIRQVRGLKQA